MLAQLQCNNYVVFIGYPRFPVGDIVIVTDRKGSIGADFHSSRGIQKPCQGSKTRVIEQVDDLDALRIRQIDRLMKARQAQ